MKILSVIAAAIFCAALAIVPAGCSSNGSGGNSGGSNSGAGPGPGAAPVPGTGFVIFPNDPLTDSNPTGGSVSSVLQSVQLFESNGTAFATPSVQTWNYNGVGDVDGAALSPDGSHGVFVDGSSDSMYFFTVQSGYAQPTTGVAPLNFATALGAGSSSDPDSVVMMNNGDEAIVSLDDSSDLILVSGINAKTPAPAQYISSGPDDGLALSNDNSVLLGRSQHGLDVFAINSVSPTPGEFPNTTVTHQVFWQTNLPLAETASDAGGRDGMAFSPTDSSRAVVITNNANGGGQSTISLLTGLPSVNALVNTTSVSANVYSVAIVNGSPSDMVIVGTGHGLMSFSGVSTGTLTPVGSINSYTASNGSTVSLGQITTLQITRDGQYVIAGDASGVLYTIPVNSGNFGTPVGVLTGVQIPTDDEMMIH